jgi:hypothetical protein
MHTARIVFSLLAFSLCAVGCDDSSTNNGADLAMGADLSASGQSCMQVVTCASKCSGMATCVQGCVANGTTNAKGLYQTLITCATGVCLQATDGGTAKCSSATDTSAGCAACIQMSAQSAACSTQLSACLAG